MKTKLMLLTAALGLAAATSSRANLLITQYYEGSSFNKYIELTNTGTTTIDFATTDFFLTLWSNANTEAWKTNGGSATSTYTLGSGTLSSGSSFLIANGSAAAPAYAIPADDTSGTINFNGDDSVVLYSDVTGSLTSNIIDAISFTDAGSEGANTSIVRLNTDVGYNLTSGSTFEDFTSVWSDIGTAAADSAAVSTEARLGFSAIPEPSVAALALIGLAVFIHRFRRK